MKLTNKHTFRTDDQQKKTLTILHDKYNENVSEFIRQAIAEKLMREKDTIYKRYSEIQTYLKKKETCPF